jgi:hypothetical protein
MRPVRKLKLLPVLARRQRQHGLRLPAAEMVTKPRLGGSNIRML